MLYAADSTNFNADGTVRRKYELKEFEGSRASIRIATALTVGTAVVVVKNILFPTEPLLHAAGDDALEFSPRATRLDIDPDLLAQALTRAGSEAPDQAENDALAAPMARKFSAVISSAFMQAEPEVAKPKWFGRSSATDSVSHGMFGIGAPSADASDVVARAQAQASQGRQSATAASLSDDAVNSERLRRNFAPISSGPLLLGALLLNETFVIRARDLLANIFDPDGDRLTVSGLEASGGVLVQLDETTWRFFPRYDDASEVAFSYVVSDGQARIEATALLDVEPRATELLTGTDGPDTLDGTTGADIIKARDGNDSISTGDGDDVVYGGAGNDLILTGAGNDLVFAGDGDDVVYAGAGDDIVEGGEGNDLIFGEAGNDLLRGDAGNDTIDAGLGNDIVFGGDGDDVVIGGLGADQLWLDAGDDQVFVTLDDQSDVIDGGDGIDWLYVADNTPSVVVDLAAGLLYKRVTDAPDQSAETAPISEAGADASVVLEPVVSLISNIENVTTGSGDDLVIGDDGANLILTGAGNDTIKSGGGNDVVNAGAGDDVIHLGDGDDVVIIEADSGYDLIDGGAGSDTIDLSAIETAVIIDVASGRIETEMSSALVQDIERYILGTGNDTILSAGGDVRVETGAGDDRIEIAATIGVDQHLQIDGGEGTDTLDLSALDVGQIVDLLNESVVGADGVVTVDELRAVETVIGTSADDTFIADGMTNTFFGGDGADMFVFRSIEDIGRGKGSRDRIADFEVGDTVDFNDLLAGLQERGGSKASNEFFFELILSDQSFDKPGQLRLRYEDFDGAPVVILDGNTDYNQDTEFELEFIGDQETLVSALTALFLHQDANQ